ncbi:MAG: bifunctional adenosylcobinamide kinase/adenosylcobinamide-phosphate guanylyltransferase [Candidatus Omnitrophota bacterium]|nr:bifunctional adenosylcobinamide kinase/adenosylcobinamide-phosphate guanylyltransferase [Candidatus Omnitrophota bacterium]
MGSFIFVIGGARSGKSRYASELATKSGFEVTFIATADPNDEEMKQRIEKHKASRPKEWKLIEENRNIDAVLSQKTSEHGLFLVDCLGLLISNLMDGVLTDEMIEKKVDQVVGMINEKKLNVILVSNDVGSGIVPMNYSARRFRDLIGLINQKCARKADKVIFMQAGIPIVIKGE